MSQKYPELVFDVLIIRENNILLGLLSDKWLLKGQRVYGVPGNHLLFGQPIGDAVRKNIKEEIDCEVLNHKIISVNANYHNGHFISIGILAEIIGEPKILNSDDWVKWDWFDKDKIPAALFPSAKNLLDSYQNKEFCICE
jgi:ADP-ribose pyrophosphatase YjhB (NUDIX family)